jgi:hypothetical protein
VTKVTWPKRRPSIEEDEVVVEKRWISEASVGPEIAIFCNGGRSSMTEDGGERILLQSFESVSNVTI